VIKGHDQCIFLFTAPLIASIAEIFCTGVFASIFAFLLCKLTTLKTLVDKKVPSSTPRQLGNFPLVLWSWRSNCNWTWILVEVQHWMVLQSAGRSAQVLARHLYKAQIQTTTISQIGIQHSWTHSWPEEGDGPNPNFRRLTRVSSVKNPGKLVIFQNPFTTNFIVFSWWNINVKTLMLEFLQILNKNFLNFAYRAMPFLHVTSPIFSDTTPLSTTRVNFCRSFASTLELHNKTQAMRAICEQRLFVLHRHFALSD